MKQNFYNNNKKAYFVRKFKKIIFITNNSNAIKRSLHKTNLNIFNYHILQCIIFLLLKKIVLVDNAHYISLTLPVLKINKIYKVNSTSEVIKEEISIESSKLEIVYDNPLSNFSYMFSDYNNLSEIYFQNMFDREVNMTYTFKNCKNLKNITFFNDKDCDLIASKGMFSNCKSLKEIDLKQFKTISGEDISYMFYNCINLTSITFNSKVNCLTKNMKGLFQNCNSLISVNIPSLSSPNVEITWNMFKKL